mgnify:CR=1 FL=1
MRKKTNRRVQYKALKLISILISPIFLPLGMIIALAWDSGNLSKAYAYMAVGMGLYLIDAWLFWWIIEAQAINQKRRGKQ